MPVISRFYGMVVKMYFMRDEHNPPHVHIIYGEYLGVIDIRTLELMVGDLPPKALSMAREWVAANQEALMEIWETQNFVKLPPLQ